MSVFLVWCEMGYEGYTLEGVFSTEEKACQKVVSLQKDAPQIWQFRIEEISVE